MPTYVQLSDAQKAIVAEVLADCPAPRSMRNFAEALARQGVPVAEIKRQVDQICRDQNARDEGIDLERARIDAARRAGA